MISFSLMRRLLLGESGCIDESLFNVEQSLPVELCNSNSQAVDLVLQQFDMEKEEFEILGSTNLDITLSDYAIDICTYIAGFVCKKVGINEKCSKCSKLILHQNESSRVCRFIKFKSAGHLFHPNSEIIILCTESEKLFKLYERDGGLKKTQVLLIMTCEIIKNVFSKFPKCFRSVDRQYLF